MLEIKNLKTERTEFQENQEWAEAESIRLRLLSSTDWTQLKDIKLQNQEEIVSWREELRSINLKKDFNTASKAKSFLKSYENTRPKLIKVPVEDKNDLKQLDDLKTQLEDSIKHQIDSALNNNNKKDNLLEVMREELDEKILLSVENIKRYIDKEISDLRSSHENTEPEIEAINTETVRDILLKSYKEQKQKELLDAGALEHVLIEAKLDQATEFLVKESNLEEYSLLENENPEVSDVDYVQSVVERSKLYFNKIYNIEKEYLQKEKLLYTMSSEELNEELKSYGHRYRCTESS